MPISKTTLNNGLRVLVEPSTSVMSASIGLWCRTGSRHETDEEAGLTHFIEHMLFKGTKKRTAKEIAEAIEGRGGMLNAFTDKEQTCYYCRVLAEDAGHAIGVLSDMLTDSLLDQVEIDRERGVILEEIKQSQDEPDSLVHEIHFEKRWGDHPLGKPIIGTSESVSSFNRSHFASYMDRRYRAENIVLAVTGNVDPDRILEDASRHLGNIASGGSDPKLAEPVGKSGFYEIAKDTEQVHFCIGTKGMNVTDEQIYTMAVLDGILGGGMSSRLFQEVREKRGLVYAIGSYHAGYSAGGNFTVYGGTSMASWPEVQKVVRAEFDKVMAGDVSEEELGRVKQNLCGTVVLALEGMSARMMRMTRNEFNHGRDVTEQETIDRIRKVSLGEITSLATNILGQEMITTTALGPFA